MTRYVRSKYSETAKKWLVYDCPYNDVQGRSAWLVRRENLVEELYLPREEYVECEPPARG